MPTNEARKVDSWDEEVTDVAPKQVDSWDEEVVDEPVKKKVTPSLNLLSGVIPSGKALLTGQKEESAPTEQKQIDLTNAPIAEDESTRTDKFIRKPIDKKKVDEIYTLSKQNESLVDEFAKSHFVLDNLSQAESIKQLNDLYAKREQAKDPQTAQAIDNQIEVIKSQPVEKQPSIQEAVLQNAQKYGNQPQDFNRPEIPMNPLTPNQILERNGMKTANTVGELHDRYIESATKLNELRPELDRTATELDAFKKDARTADFKTDKSGNKTLEGLADVPEAFGLGFGGTMKSIEQGFVNLLGDKQDRIDYAKKRYLEDNVLYPTRTKGMLTSGSEMVGGVAPYMISTALLPETALLGHVIINGLTMGASGYGNGYYEMFAKQKQQGASDEEADAIAMQNAKFEGAKETAIGASLPFMGGAGSKLFLAPAEKSAMKQFLATQGVIIPTFTAGKLASNVYQKYGLGEKDVNLGDGLAETAENGLILGAMMEFAHKAPPKLKELYRANLSEQYPSIQQAVDKAVKDGAMDASQGYAFTEKLKRDYAVFNAMPKDITTEQKLLIEPEVKQIIELSNREPSAVESPELIKDKIARLQKQVAEKLGTPLTEKEQKAYEKLLERQKPIKSESGKEITLELFPSEKAELEHFDKRIKASEENQAKLEEEAKVVEDKEQTPPASDVESTAKALEGASKSKPTIWQQVKDFVKGVAKKATDKLGIVSNEQHISNFEKAKAEWDKLSNRDKKLKRVDYELDDLHHSEGGYYQVGKSLIDLDLNSSHLKLLLENNKFLGVLNKLGVTKIHGENRPAEEMFAHYSDGKIHLNNNSAFENIRQVTYAMSHELGHHEWTKLTKEERDYVRSLPLETRMAKHYETQEKNGGKQTSASLQEENFADYVMQYFQGKLYGDEALLNKIPTKLREIFDNKYADLLKDNEHTEVSEAYHKAKADGSNPELVKAVESLLSKEQTPTASDVESTAKVIEDSNKWYKAEKQIKDKDGNDITLTIDKNKEDNHFYIKATDSKGNEIGSALFETDNGKVWSGNEIEVNEGNRRKGIMSAMYDFAESEGHPLEPTKSLSKEGKAFWENRKSESLLSKEQTPPALRDVESTAKALEGVNEKELEFITIKNSIRELPDKDFNDKEANDNWVKLQEDRKRLKNNDELLKKEIENVSNKRKANQTVYETMFNLPIDKGRFISEAYHKAKADGSNPELVKAVEHFLKETTKAETPTKTSTQEDVLKPFADIINESNSFEEAFDKVRSIKDVPQETADAFSQKYATEQGTSPQQAFRKFYDEVKSQKSATTETGKSGSGDIEIAKRVNNLGEFDNEIRGVTNQRRIPNEIKERYIEALRTLAINKEIGIDHPQAKRYESVYDILDANEKKKEPNKKFNKEDTFSEKSKSYFTPHELIPNVGESFDDAQKRAEKHFGMKSPYPIELIKEAKEIFSGFSYASEGFNDYVYERMQESTKKTTEPSLSQKENKLVTEEIKTAIDNGEITREQVDGFTEQDESAIEDIERKAESENEAELNSAIDQADKLIGEAVGATEGEKQPTDKGTSEDKVTGIKKAMVEKDRADAGLPPIELPKSNKPQEQLERAKELVDSGEVDPSELEAYLISHAENPSDAKTSEADQYILQYQRMKIEARSKEILTERMAIEDRLKEDPTDVQANLDLASNEIARQQNIYDLDRNTTASRVTSSIWGKLGNAKQQVINERGIVQEQINRIKELHGKDVPKEVQDKLDSLEKKNTELTARIEAIEKNITEQIAQGQLNKESRKPLIRRTSRRSDEEINAQIKDKLSTIANKIAERIEKSAVKNFAANKEQSKSLIADIAPDVMDVVKLVSEKTGNKLEDVVNKTYDAIKDITEGIGKRDIVDIIAGKYSDKKPLSELQKQINDIRSQARLNERIDELEKGILRETQKRGESSEEVKKLRERANELMKKSKNDLANFSANELKKQVEQLQKKIDKGEFLPQKTVKKAFEQDANWVKYSQEKKKLKQELNHLEAQALYDKKNLYMKTLDQFNKFSRLGLFIFSTAYQLKLAAAALSTIAHKPIEDLVGTAIKPMVKEIADRAPIEGRNINAEATAEFYKNLSPIKILRGAYQILSKGESDLSRELSSHPKKEGNIFNPLSDHSVLNWIADDPHKIIKNPIKQGIFDASLANYMNYYASKGMDINDPILIEKARQASYMRAEYEIFMGGENSKTAVSEWFKKMESEGILDAQSESFKTKVGGNLKYSISALKNFIVPIASVPANILNRTVKNNPISTAYRFSEALKTNSELKNNVTETLDNLTEAQADLMLRDLKKGAIGSVYWTLGFIMAGNALGGFFNKSYPDKKRDKDEKGHDEMEIFGKNIPHGVQHAVPLQQMQMAATFALTLKYFNEQDKKKLKDDFGLKDEIKNVGAGGAEIARTYINEHPMSKASLDIVKALEGGKGREKYFNSLERRSDIPQTKFLLQDIGLIEKDDSYEKQKAKSKKHNEVKDLYDVFWYMMDDKKFENHNE